MGSTLGESGSRYNEWENPHLQTECYGGRSSIELRGQPILKGPSASHIIVMSDTESSDHDTSWSGSAVSSWMSSSSVSGIRPRELHMSSLPAEEAITERGMKQSLHYNKSSSTNLLRTTETEPEEATVLPTPMRELDFISSKANGNSTDPRNQVDYLSYSWNLDDISTSWKFMSSNKKTCSNGARLEYASWRVWEKLRSDLKTVTPESLNWLKESDTTWLYGPLKRAPRNPFTEKSNSQNSTVRVLPITPSSTSFSRTKPILKKSDIAKEDVVLLRSLSDGSLANRVNSVEKWRRTLRISGRSSPSSKIGSLEKPLSQKEHVHFGLPEEDSADLDKDRDEGTNQPKLCSRSYDGGQRFADGLYAQTLTLATHRSEMPEDMCSYNKEALNSQSKSNKRPRVRSSSPAPKTMLAKSKKRPSIFFLEDSDDDEFDMYTPNDIMEQVVGKASRENVSTSEIIPTAVPSVEEQVEYTNKPKPLPSKEALSWHKFHTAMAKLNAIPVLEPHEAKVEGNKSDHKTTLSATTRASNYKAGRSFKPVKSPILRRSAFGLRSLPAFTMGRLISSRKTSQEGKDSIDEFQFGSVPPKTDIEDEDAYFPFHIGELDLPSAGADLSEMILHRRRRDWWFKKEGMITSTLDSNQTGIMPSLTQIWTSPAVDELCEISSAAEEPQVMFDEMPGDRPTDSIHVSKSYSTATPMAVIDQLLPSENSSISELATSDTNTLTPEIVAQRSLDIVASLDSDDLGDASDVRSDMDECESMTESYEDDSLGSASDESMFDQFGDAEGGPASGQCLNTALDPMQQAMVNRIMEEFWTVFNQDWSKGIRQCIGESSEPSGCQQSNGSVDLVSSSSSTGPRKRRKRDDKPPGRGNGKGFGGADNPMNVEGDSNETVRFACPFRKHDGCVYNIYEYSVCALSSWPSIARVKEHLYRAHRIAIHCKRCWEVFGSQELLDAHLTVAASEICDLRLGSSPDGLTSEKERFLRSRKKSSPNQSNEDRWRDIYKILFPNEEVPSPYFEPVEDKQQMSPHQRELAHYEAYMRHELPRVVRRNVEEAVHRAFGPLESSLIGDMINIVRDSQDAVFRSYRQSQGSSRNTTGLPQSQPPEHNTPAFQFNAEDLLPVQQNDSGQQQGLITSMFQAPPPPPSESSPSSMILMNSMTSTKPMLYDHDDQEQDHSTTLTDSPTATHEMRSDSGYASEDIFLLCGCCTVCNCGNGNVDVPGPQTLTTRTAIDIVVPGCSVGSVGEWNDWTGTSGWNPLHSMGATFDSGWDNDG